MPLPAIRGIAYAGFAGLTMLFAIIGTATTFGSMTFASFVFKLTLDFSYWSICSSGVCVDWSTVCNDAKPQAKAAGAMCILCLMFSFAGIFLGGLDWTRHQGFFPEGIAAKLRPILNPNDKLKWALVGLAGFFTFLAFIGMILGFTLIGNVADGSSGCGPGATAVPPGAEKSIGPSPIMMLMAFLFGIGAIVVVFVFPPTPDKTFQMQGAMEPMHPIPKPETASAYPMAASPAKYPPQHHQAPLMSPASPPAPASRRAYAGDDDFL